DRDMVSSKSISDNNWHHIALTGDGSTLTLYVDGISVGTLPGNQSINSSAGLNIGAARWGGASFFHQGTYDNLTLWNFARTQAQIQADMNSGYIAVPQSGLVAFYRFNNASATPGGNNSSQTTA